MLAGLAGRAIDIFPEFPLPNERPHRRRVPTTGCDKEKPVCEGNGYSTARDYRTVFSAPEFAPVPLPLLLIRSAAGRTGEDPSSIWQFYVPRGSGMRSVLCQ